MTDQASPFDVGSRTKRVPVQDRSVVIGDLVVINAYRANLSALKQRFLEGKYTAKETDHFLLFERSEAPSRILVHWFDPEQMNADIKHYVTMELKPLGIIQYMQDYGEILAGIVSSLFPDDARRAWRFFGANTLQRFLTFLATAYTPPLPNYATIGMFATLYQRVCELRIGDSFLDAGCESGFLPLLIAERIPFLEKIVGVDINENAFKVAQELAEDRKLFNVAFIQEDLLSRDFKQLGSFDTVTALHVLEHFSEDETPKVLSNLLAATSQRLILAVPYEQEPEIAYGHKQTFSHVKLEDIGQWCLQQLEGKGRLWLEDCVGGLLLIEKRL